MKLTSDLAPTIVRKLLGKQELFRFQMADSSESESLGESTSSSYVCDPPDSR